MSELLDDLILFHDLVLQLQDLGAIFVDLRLHAISRLLGLSTIEIKFQIVPLENELKLADGDLGHLLERSATFSDLGE